MQYRFESPSTPDLQAFVMTLRQRRYRVLRQLSRKSHSIVFLAKQETLDRDVVLKFVFTDHPVLSERCRREVNALSLFRHPNNVRILDSGEGKINGREGSCLITEYIRGQSLHDVITSRGSLGLLRSVHVVRQILLALAEAHRLGVVHRDVKPTNVMLSEHDGQRDHVTVLDYGVASLAADQSPPFGEDRAPIRTPEYTAPEVLAGGAPTVASDLYSAGVILYNALTGQLPFTGRDAQTVWERQRREPKLVGELIAAPPELSALVARAIALDPTQRVDSALAFVAALDALPLADLVAHEVPDALRDPTIEAEIARAVALEELAAASHEAAEPVSSASLRLSSQRPVVWVFCNDPGVTEETIRLIQSACVGTEVVRIDPEERTQWTDWLLSGHVPEPWLVVFGDLHVILQDDLLYSLAERGEICKMLVSTHLNAEMLHSAANFAGVDHQLVLPVAPLEVTRTVQALLGRSRRIRQRYDRLRVELVNARRQLAPRVGRETTDPDRAAFVDEEM